MSGYAIRADDLSGAPTRALIAAHLDGMRDTSPPDSVHALGLAGLQRPDVTLWTAWDGEQLAGMGALQALDAERGEVKSMRVDDAHLGRGVGRMLLRHIVTDARRRGMTSLWLETGSAAAFVPAQRFYASEGFIPCDAFEQYPDDPFSVYLTLAL